MKGDARHVVRKKGGAYVVVDTHTGEVSDGPYPPRSKKRPANPLDRAWAEGKAGRLNAEHAAGDRPDQVENVIG